MTISLSETLESGITCLQKNELQKAEKFFREVLHLHKNNIDALHLLGILKLREGQIDVGLAFLEKAVRYCKRSLKKEPDNIQLSLLLAYLYIDLQQWDEAENAFREALKISPDLSEAYNGLGSIYFNKGQVQRAYSMFYQSLKKDSENVEALYNQGIVLRSLGELKEAEQTLGKAVKLSPGHIQALSSLGLTLQELGKLDDAKKAYKKVLDLAPDNSFSSHMLAAIEGKTSSKAPNKFISDLFDAYAPSYEQHLQESLEFKAPDVIVSALDECCEKYLPFLDVLDIGCGTGLMAEKLKGRARHIDGVDLSKKMLDIANTKGLYRSLELNDIDDYLQSSLKSYDCCIASDVFIYSGDLRQIFASIFKSLKNGGQFVFTIESTINEEYILLKSGRYAHSVAYVKTLAKENNFEISLQKSVRLRKEEGHWLEGFVFTLVKLYLD